LERQHQPSKALSAARYLALIVFLLGGFCSAAFAETPLPKTLDALKAKAAQGDAQAQLNLGIAYHDGKGVPRDDVEAVKWYRQAAAQGNAQAQSNLGVMYHQGEGVPRDDAEAVKWYRQAAAQGDAWAQYNLGITYERGEGVPRDDAEAVEWYRQAAAQGVAQDRTALCLMLVASALQSFCPLA
jgi:TPR repeat protein